MKKNGAKPIEPGEIFWFTYEHIYTQEGEILPRVEYCVLCGEFRKFVMGGKEMVVVGKTPDRGNVPFYFYPKNIGARVFRSPREAANLARRQTDRHERIWGRTGEPPARRPWAHYLEEQEPVSTVEPIQMSLF